MEAPFRPQRLLRLGLYTTNAADVIQEALVRADDAAFKGYRITWFSNDNGTFGKFHHTAYVIVLPDGELALEKYETRYGSEAGKTLPTDVCLEVLKHAVASYAEMHKALYADKSAALFTTVKKAKQFKQQIEDIIACSEVVLKRLGGEELTEEEKKWAGRPMNAFEQIELGKLLEELYKNMKQWNGKNPNRAKIRSYMRKIQNG